jgi:hypothetical protein
MLRSYTNILPGLWLGTEKAVLDEELWDTDPNINLVIDLTDTYERSRGLVQRVGVHISDIEFFNEEDLPVFNSIVARLVSSISAHLDGGRGSVLVVCEMGINRSAFVVTSYLIKIRGYSPQDAIVMVENSNRHRGQRTTLPTSSFEGCLDPKIQIRTTIRCWCYVLVATWHSYVGFSQ